MYRDKAIDSERERAGGEREREGGRESERERCQCMYAKIEIGTINITPCIASCSARNHHAESLLCEQD